jgi:hypothetical protein
MHTFICRCQEMASGDGLAHAVGPYCARLKISAAMVAKCWNH